MDIGLGIMAERSATHYVLLLDGITVHVTRKRVKNINYRIDGSGRACMSVPWHISRDRAEQYARSRLGWFRERLRMREEVIAVPREWESGEKLWVWGELATLEVVETDGVPTCSLVDGRLVLRVPHGSTADGRARFVDRWLADQLRERLVELVPACEQRVGVRAASITLRHMKSRWGSCTCSKRTIRLNTALAGCPPACLEMVLVHELCHILEANHGPRFHALMDLHCPGWRAFERWLDEHPPR